MTHTEQFIHDAFQGNFGEEMSYTWASKNFRKILLDPLFWQAVGKTRGWKNSTGKLSEPDEWKFAWHQFIDHLADGLTIEEALAKLT